MAFLDFPASAGEMTQVIINERQTKNTHKAITEDFNKVEVKLNYLKTFPYVAPLNRILINIIKFCDFPTTSICVFVC